MAFQPQPLFQDAVSSGTLSALDDVLILEPSNASGAIVNISGTWAGTILFEGTNDNFITNQNASVFTPSSGVITTGVSSNGYYRFVAVSGFTKIRARMSAYTSGTASVVLSASLGSGLAPTVSVNYDSMLGTSKIKGSDGLYNADVLSRSNSSKALATQSEIAGSDSLATFRNVQTKVRSDGLTALVTDATVVVESTFGFDQQPDSYFQIINTGEAGNTWTVFIRGTSNDPTSPDRDLPDYTKIFTVVAGEVGDEIKLRDRIIQELNADTTFKNTVFLKAAKATDRAIVHIQSTKFSVSGDFYERPASGDFNITVTGTAVRVIGFDNLISRSKPVTISRDRDSPHRLGLFGVTGSVTVTAKELSDLFIQEALNSGSPQMTVNGSVTPVEFTVPASETTDLFIEHLIFDGQANGIKFGQFMGQNASLTNGIEISIKSDDIITTFPVIKSTEDFKNKWASLSGTGASFRLDVQAGRDEVLAIFSFPNPFLLRVAGSFTTDDYIKVKVRDNLTSNIQRLNFRAKGFEKEP